MTSLAALLPRARARRAAWRLAAEQATVREVLMGAQDNLTNVLAVVLGVAIGSGRADFIALAGLSAGIAEAVSMGGVLYNSTRAEQRLAAQAAEGTATLEHRLRPAMSGLVTFASALVAGLIPLAPFIVLPVPAALVCSVALSVVGLFCLGALVGRIGGDRWWQEGLRLLVVAIVAALAAASVGALLQVG
jgi:predicted membrane protein (TIGR00267 family)